MLDDPLFWPAIRNSVALGLSAGLLSTLVGVTVAWQLAHLPPRQRDIWMALLGLPLAFSGMVIAYGFILAFGRAGFVTQLLGYLGADPAEFGAWIYTVGGLTLAYAYYLIPRVALTLYPVFTNLDPRPIEAARTLGASPYRAFCNVVLPEIAPSVGASCALVSALAMGTYGTALALVGTQVNILPLLLYAKIGDGGADFPAAGFGQRRRRHVGAQPLGGVEELQQTHHLDVLVGPGVQDAHVLGELEGEYQVGGGQDPPVQAAAEVAFG